ncbi:sulfatase [Aureibaculum algae]|uniref:Sulfatase n=1 Tax=Aureibaculum algae TaxID=2584122 RepID=A0A5B7U006_9FLAO|nr:sulfatase [Aureibaculum algae]QCX40292.1 sulfatase [Aureibaculum algae]
MINYKQLIFLIVLNSVFLVQAQKRPNIIYIMTDDHATTAIGAYQGRLAGLNPSPNIDKLASEGMLFNNCYVTNSICSPSRATIITGQYSQTNRILDFSRPIDADQQYLPEEMQKLGYETAIIGKWHLHSEPIPFDFYSVLPGQGKYHNPELLEKGAGDWPDNLVKNVGHSSDVITDKAIDWLTNRKDKEKPFFLMYQFKAPHDMFEYAERYEAYLANVKIPEPENLYTQPNWGSEATRGKNDSLRMIIGSSVSNRHNHANYVKTFQVDSTYVGDAATSESYQRYLKKYLRCVKGVDDNIGRFFQFLKDNDLYENTIIVYTTDQGMMLGEHDFIDKRWMYEESMRMPLIIRYPDIVKANSKTDVIVNNTDFAPTLIDLAGGKVPDKMQGKSMAEILEGKTPKGWRTATYYRYWLHMTHHDIPGHFGIRTDRYKLIFFYGRHWDLNEEGKQSRTWLKEGASNKVVATPPAWELYDLEKDPTEVNNVYANPAYSEVVKELKLELEKQREQYNETDINYPHIQKIVDDNWDK